jgi:hypothetical protein
VFKLLVREIEAWMKSERVMYASGEGKRLFVTVHAGPGVKRYIVHNMRTGEDTGFTNRGQAVRFFNNLNLS